MDRHHRAPVPLTASHDELVERTRDLDLRHGATEAWAHLDARDAARAIELSLLTEAVGAHAVFVAADTTSVPYPTEDLLDRYPPGVPRLRRFVDREVPIDLTRARTLLGFRAQYPLEVQPDGLPG